MRALRLASDDDGSKTKVGLSWGIGLSGFQGGSLSLVEIL